MKPRVLLVSTVHPSNDIRVVYKIAPALSLNYEVVCVLPNGHSVAHLPGVRVVALPKSRYLMVRAVFSFPVVLLTFLVFRPKIVHLCVPELIPLGFLFERMGASIVLEVQENLYKKLDRKRINNARWLRQLFRLFEQKARSVFHYIFTEDAYLPAFPGLLKSSTVVHNYVDLIRFHSSCIQAAAESPSFVYCGVISMDRGLGVMLGALELLRVRFPDCRLHLIGRLELRSEELHVLEQMQLWKENLVFYGFVDPSGLPALYRKNRFVAGLAVLQAVGDYTDSYPTKIFEYMAMGLPVIASDFPLYQSVVETHFCGYCVPPDRPECLAESMLELLVNRELRAQMSENSKIAVTSHFNWSTESATLLAFYQAITPP